MKHLLYVLPALMLTVPQALAWPFVWRDTGLGIINAANQGDAGQWDNDHPLELVTGGDGVTQISATGELSQTPFPQFDSAPYPAGTPQVTFQGGRAATGDIDGDGDLDVVRSAYLYYNGTEELNSGRLMTCRNNGNGTFTRTWHWLDNTGSVGTAYRAPSLKLADLDRDGDLDLIETYGRVRIHWNPGDGDFSAAPLSIGPTFKGVAEIEIADFDGDGWQDIALFAPIPGLDASLPDATTGRLVMLRNDALTWTATTVHTRTLKLDYGHTVCADFSGDGKPDLVVSAPTGGDLEIHYFQNLGTGFMAPTSLGSTNAYNNAPIAAGDLDEDGIRDIVICSLGDDLSWLRRTGGGTFAPLTVLRAVVDIYPPRGISVADMDGDGDNDVITGGGRNFFENTAIHRDRSATVVDWSGTGPSGVVDLTTGDLNNDGKPDLIAADGGGKRIMWFSANGTGLNAQFPVTTANLAPASVAAGDFNGDGRTDLAWTTPNILTQALSLGSNGLAYSFSDIANLTGITRILPQDYDLDGDLDLLSISGPQNIVRWQRNAGSSWLPVNVATDDVGVTAMACGQQIPGGRPEIATLSMASSGNGYLQRYAWSGAAWTGNAVTNVTPGTGSRAVIMADLQDSTPGLETVFAINGSAISLSHPSLSTTPAVGFGVAAVNQLAAADWNGDGFTDLLSATSTGVNLYLHQRGSTWVPSNPTTLYTGAAQQDLVIMDLDADGLPDAVTVEATTGKLRLLYNTSGAIRRIWQTMASLPLIPSQGASPFRQFAAHRGAYRSPSGTFDAAAAPADLRFRFLNAVSQSGSWVPGSALTQAQVSALVESIAILDNATTSPQSAASASPSSVNANGYFIMTLSAAARTALLLGPGGNDTYDFKIRLKSSAGSAGLSRFFVEFHPESAWVALDAANNFAGGPSALSVNGDSSIQRTLISLVLPGLLDTWRKTNFGTYDTDGPAANDADPDGDDLSNLVEYVMSQNPNLQGGIGSSSAIGLTAAGMNTALIADLRLLTTYDSKVRLTLQQSTALNAWTSLSTRTGTGAWTGTVPTTGALNGGRTRFEFATGAIPATTPKYFLRLLAEELP